MRTPRSPAADASIQASFTREQLSAVAPRPVGGDGGFAAPESPSALAKLSAFASPPPFAASAASTAGPPSGTTPPSFLPATPSFLPSVGLEPLLLQETAPARVRVAATSDVARRASGLVMQRRMGRGFVVARIPENSSRAAGRD